MRVHWPQRAMKSGHILLKTGELSRFTCAATGHSLDICWTSSGHELDRVWTIFATGLGRATESQAQRPALPTRRSDKPRAQNEYRDGRMLRRRGGHIGAPPLPLNAL